MCLSKECFLSIMNVSQTEVDDGSSPGLPAYLELAIVSGLTDSIQRHLGECARKEQGWTDTQIIMSLFLLNIAGGDSVDDLRILEKDNVAYVIICSSPVATFYNAQISYNMIINSFNVQ